MRFTVILGAPYLVANGKAYPVDISGDSVTYFKEGSTAYKSEGELSLDEVRAKFGTEIKHKESKRRKKSEA